MQNQGEYQNNKVDGGTDVRRVHGVKDIVGCAKVNSVLILGCPWKVGGDDVCFKCTGKSEGNVAAQMWVHMYTYVVALLAKPFMDIGQYNLTDIHKKDEPL
jgi:hypothetical protein